MAQQASFSEQEKAAIFSLHTFHKLFHQFAGRLSGRVSGHLAGALFIGVLGLLAAGQAAAQSGIDHGNYSVDRTLRSNARVNPSTLAMEFSIPLPNYPGRAGNSLAASINYSSKLWSYGDVAHYTVPYVRNNVRPVYSESSYSGWSSQLGVPQIEYTPDPYLEGGRPWVYDAEFDSDPYSRNLEYIKRLHIIMPDGSTAELRADDAPHSAGTTPFATISLADQYSGTFLSVDGSRMRLEFSYSGTNLTGNILYMPDGGRYFDLPLWDVTAHSGTVTYIDRSGNRMTYDRSTDEWTDTLGRTIKNPFWINKDTVIPTAGNQDIPFPKMTASTTDPTPIRLVWESLSTQRSTLAYVTPEYDCSGYAPQPSGSTVLFTFSGPGSYYVCGNSSQFNPTVLTAVIMPNGAKYKFSYNIYGEIERIDYPTGGYERFEYDYVDPLVANHDVLDQFNRGVKNRWVSPDGTSGSEIQYHYEAARETTGPAAGIYHVKSYNPDGTWSEQLMKGKGHSVSPSYGLGDPSIGRAFESRAYDNTTSNTLLRRTLTQWTNTGSLTIGGLAGASNAKRDLRPEKEISVIFEPGSTSALATMSETVYDTADIIGSTDIQYFSALNAKQTKTYNFKVISSLTTARTGSFSTLESSFGTGDVANIQEANYLYDADYKTRNICGLVTESKLEDGAGNPKAKSEMTYDGTGLWASTGTMPTGAAGSWVNLTLTTELGSVVGSKRGLPTGVKKYYDLTNSLYIETKAYYDQFGNPRKAQDGNNNETETFYDAANAFAYPTSVITAAPDSGTYGQNAGLTNSTTYNYNTGLPLTTTDANGQVTEMSYADPSTGTIDPLLRPRKVTAPNGQQTLSEYGVPGSSGQFAAGQRFVRSSTQIDSVHWKQGYNWGDGLGRTIKTQSVNSNGDIFTDTEYDTMGRVKRTSNPYRTGETKYWTTPTYDLLGRTTAVAAPDASGTSSVTFAYGLSTSAPIGVTKTVTDQAGKKRRGIADSLGRTVRVIEDPDTLNLATDYTFDTAGNLCKTVQGAQSRYFMYDAVGRLLYARQPEQDANSYFSGAGYTDPVTSNNQWSVKYEYDNNSNITKTTDARNISIAGTYDHLNRLIIRDYQNDSGVTPDVTFFYDGKGLPSAPANSIGKTTKVTSTASENRYTSFDNMGRLLASEQRTPFDLTTESVATAIPRSFEYTYNLSGALLEEKYPSGRIVRNTVDENGELSQVQTKKNADYGFLKYAGGIHTNAAGMVDRMQLGNGRWETAAYNNRLQVRQMGLGLTPDDQNLLKLEFGYNTTGNNDNNGAMLSQKITVPTEGANTGFTATQTYTYDSLNRIHTATETVSGSQTWKQTFDIDRYGNRKFDTTGTNTTTPDISTNPNAVNPAINTSDNRLSSGQGYSYDANGNLIQDNNNTAVPNYVYDAESRQIAVQNSSLVDKGRYDYDGEGRRIRKTSDAERTVFVYDGAGQLAAEYSTALATTPQVSYTTADHLGSPRIVTNQTGDITSRKDFNAYGEETFTSQRTTGLHYLPMNQPREVRQDYTGYQKDEESGLEYAQARYYNAGHGRFTSVDPLTASATIKDPQTFNRYTYALNSPYKFTDPLGLSAVGTYWNNPNPGEGGPGGAFSGAASGFGEGQGLSDSGLSFALADSQVTTQASGHINAGSPGHTDTASQTGPDQSTSAAAQTKDVFEKGLPEAPRTGPSTPVLAVVDEPGGEIVSRKSMSKPAIVKVYDQYGKRVTSAEYTLTEEIVEVKLSPEISKKQSSIGSSTLDQAIEDKHFIKPANGYEEFTDNVLYIRRQIMRVESDNMDPRDVGYYLIKTTITGTEIINCNNGCTKAQLGTDK